MTPTTPSEDLTLLLNADFQKWPDYPAYRQLSRQDSEVRLIQIYLCAETKKLCGNMFHARLDDPLLEYEALSYCWGPPDRQLPFTIDGHQVTIRSSLHTFLTNLCSQPRGHVRPVRLDSICINQRDSDERSSQVALMGQIYSKAVHVLAWLGDFTSDAEYVFLYLQHHHYQSLQNCAHRSWLKDKARESIEDIVQRPYWKRLWIIQELALAKRAYLWCGNRWMEWDQFQMGLKYLDVYGRNGRPKLSEIMKFIDFTQTVRPSPMLPTKPDTDSVDKTPSLVTRIRQFSAQRCEDPRDRVYALANLATDGTHLNINYTKNMLEVIMDIVMLTWASPRRVICPRINNMKKLLELVDEICRLFGVCPHSRSDLEEWAGSIRSISDGGIIHIHARAYSIGSTTNAKTHRRSEMLSPSDYDILFSNFSQYTSVCQILHPNVKPHQHFLWRVGRSLRQEDVGFLFYPHRSTDWPHDTDIMITWPVAWSQRPDSFKDPRFVFRPTSNAHSHMRFIGVINYGEQDLRVLVEERSRLVTLAAEDDYFRMTVADEGRNVTDDLLEVHIEISDVLLFVISLARDRGARQGFWAPRLFQELCDLIEDRRRRRWSMYGDIDLPIAPSANARPQIDPCGAASSSREHARYQLRDACQDLLFHTLDYARVLEFVQYMQPTQFADYSQALGVADLWITTLDHVEAKAYLSRVFSESLRSFRDKSQLLKDYNDTMYPGVFSSQDDMDTKIRLGNVELLKIDRLVYHIGMMRVAELEQFSDADDGGAEAGAAKQSENSTFEEFWIGVGLLLLTPFLQSEEEFLAGALVEPHDVERLGWSIEKERRKMKKRYADLRCQGRVWQHYDAIKATLEP